MAVPAVGSAPWRDRYGPWAVVVGGAHGLGAAWTDGLAAAGLAVALLDRDAAGVADRVRAIEANGGAALGLTHDLAEAPVVPALSEALGDREVGLVVVNAACAPVGPFLADDPARHRTALEVNCGVALDLAHAYGPALVRRGRGGLVLTSSLAGFQGTPRVATYAATKAFLLNLGEALAEEWRADGVDVLVLAPGATRTPAYLATDPQDDRGPIMDPEPVVQEALRALGHRVVHVPGAGNRWARRALGTLGRSTAVRILDGAMRRRYPDED